MFSFLIAASVVSAQRREVDYGRVTIWQTAAHRTDSHPRPQAGVTGTSGPEVRELLSCVVTLHAQLTGSGTLLQRHTQVT
jgi:hypothetical protein